MRVQIPTMAMDLVRALQDSIDRKKRSMELESQPRAVDAPIEQNGEWLAQGRSVNVQGFATGDFVYAGSRLAALDGYRVEPSLINPSLPVDPSHANVHGEAMTYWPSYDSISASSRRAYLQWLAGGRRDPNAYVGYVFIFFYGLERRIFEYLHGRGSNADEVLLIAREVARLLDLYAATSGSFAGYGTSLLDLIAALEPRARDLARTRPPRESSVPQHVRMALGLLAQAGKPIPAQHALTWVASTSVPNTPAVRCASEFELLFHVRYAKQFGEGLVIQPNKTFVQLGYHPASATIGPFTRATQIPDVTVLTRPLQKLIALAEECSFALDAFSRFLGKNDNGRESLAAFALLPEELVEGTPSSDARALASLVHSRLDDKGRAHLGAGELLQFVRLAKPDKVQKNEAMLLAQALEKLGYGIEPDVRLGGPAYEVEGRVVVFRRLPDCPSIASDEYATAMLLIRLGAMVSAADDAISQSERELLEHHIEERLQLTPGERQRLAAHLAWILEADLGFTGLKRKLDALPRDSRQSIGRVLVGVAATDGQVDAREMKILEKLYGLLELPLADLYRDAHAVQSQDDEPVAMTPAIPGAKTFAIPPKPAPGPGIDMERVRLKIAETRQVSTLLSSIFVEEEAPVAVAPAISQANTIGTLDAAHSELLRRLAQRESWPRDEVERLADELSLLTDGALETINDYAYATFDAPLWEDDDPVAINSNIAMELTV
jgi:tellurite resistance protein